VRAVWFAVGRCPPGDGRRLRIVERRRGPGAGDHFPAGRVDRMKSVAMRRPPAVHNRTDAPAESCDDAARVTRDDCRTADCVRAESHRVDHNPRDGQVVSTTCTSWPDEPAVDPGIR